MKRTVLLCGCLWMATSLLAQQEFGLPNMRGVWQSAKINPALLTNHKLVIGLPGLHNTLYFSGPTYGDAITTTNGSSSINVDGLVAALEDRNLVQENLEIETISAVVGLGPVHLSVSHTTRFNAYLNYPKALPQLIWQGNAQFIGETIDLSNDLQIYSYQEFALGAASTFGPVSVGVRAKYLSGIGDLSTEQNEASLFTDPEFYALDLQADYLLNSAGFLNYNSYSDFNLNLQFGELNAQNLFTQNTGFAFDVGAELELDKLRIGVSALDLGGSINWEEQVSNYAAEGSFTYDGLDISAALTGDSSSIDNALDTLSNIFMVSETNNAYSTELPTRVYLTGGYDLNENFSVGVLYYGEWYRGEQFNGFALSANYDVLSFINVGASYGVFRDTYANLGLNTSVNLGPVQVYAISDNILGLFSPAKSRYFTFRAGLNLVLAKAKEDE